MPRKQARYGQVAVYNSTAPTYSDGDDAGLQVDGNGNLFNNIASRLDYVNDAVTSVSFGHSYANITTNTSTTLKTGAGVLKSIKVNNPSALTVANLVIVAYDNTASSGSKIATITVPFGLTSALPFNINFDCAFTTGLTINTSGPTVTGDLTIEYR